MTLNYIEWNVSPPEISMPQVSCALILFPSSGTQDA